MKAIKSFFVEFLDIIKKDKSMLINSTILIIYNIYISYLIYNNNYLLVNEIILCIIGLSQLFFNYSVLDTAAKPNMKKHFIFIFIPSLLQVLLSCYFAYNFYNEYI